MTMHSAKLSVRGLITGMVGALAITASATGLQAMEQKPVQIITAGTGGSWFPTGATIADLANQSFDGQPVSVIPGAGAIGNIARVGVGKSDMGLSYGPFLKLAKEGGNDINPGEGYDDLRAILALNAYPFHFLVADSVGISSLDELKDIAGDINLASEVTGSSMHFIVQRMFENYGLPLDEIEKAGGSVQQLNTDGRKDAWQNGQVNMASFMFAPPHPVIIEQMRIRDSQIMGFTDEVLDQLTGELGFDVFELTSEHYPKQKAATKTVAMPTLLFGTADLDDELVYELVKNVANNKQRMVNAVGSLESWNPEDMVKGLGIEIHPGALKFYKEQGWID
ncbi:TAXI family TRAP transporter solute-binding subunit [Limimaricola pyoseonensis]|uniref:TRAP transporter solute receptor, TAXI family n=1 Tax=Limimaricola pyoseonensis TaxID=521013 RepID=A0A1G7HU95_9RHOB|nr:TAXI family TRAP transporter solute-binding subunit [Limimaricola pyoseonensis]SDF03985.1 TRAP transporter solute receptor, TAXI family [Limimaricola pyoseonensis]